MPSVFDRCLLSEKTYTRPKVAIVICTLNEESNLPHVLPRIPSWVDEILIVDGRSSDRTVEVAKRLVPKVRILYQPEHGKGDALKHGFRMAVSDIIVTLDADGASYPEEVATFIDPLLRGYDFVKGTRLRFGKPKQMRMHRWIGNKILCIVTSILFGVRVTDLCSGYNAFWKETVCELKLRTHGFEMEQELLAKVMRHHLKMIEIPHSEGGRIGGRTKVRDLMQGIIDLLTVMRFRFVD